MSSFQQLTRDLGFDTSPGSDPYTLTLSNGKTVVKVRVGFFAHGSGQTPYVGIATGFAEYSLPKAWPKQNANAWLKSEDIQAVNINTYLGGKVVLQAHVGNPKSTRSEVRQNLRLLFHASQRFHHLATVAGGKSVDFSFEPGQAPLDLNYMLEAVDAEDLDYLRVQLKWGNQVIPGGGRGWMTGAEPEGVPVYFSGMPNSQAGFFLTSMGQVNQERLDRANLQAITWATVLSFQKSIHIQKFVDTAGGKTVKDIRDEILSFSRSVKALNLL